MADTALPRTRPSNASAATFSKRRRGRGGGRGGQLAAQPLGACRRQRRAEDRADRLRRSRHRRGGQRVCRRSADQADGRGRRVSKTASTRAWNNLRETAAGPGGRRAGQCFVGFDAYEKLLATDVDVVILATPPHFRPAHLKAAIASGKHVFCEKPVAVDAPGVRSVLETDRSWPGRKNLTLVSGLCYRYDPPKVELIKRIHDGAIGDVADHAGQLQHRHALAPRPRARRGATWNTRCATGCTSPGCRAISTSSSTCTASTRPPGRCATSRRCKATGLGRPPGARRRAVGQHLRSLRRDLRIRERHQAVRQLPPAWPAARSTFPTT